MAITLSGDGIARANLAADIIDSTKLADDAVDSEHYAAGSIDTAHIANDQITAALMADNSIDSDMYVDGSIDNAHIADDQIDSEHYVDGSIDTAHIGDDQVTADKLANAINTDIATGVTGGTVAAAALPKAGGTMTGDVTLEAITETKTTKSTSFTPDLTNDGTLYSCTGTMTITMPTAEAGKSFTIIHATATSITWSGTIEWNGGSEPTKGSGIDIYVFISDGTNWYANQAGTGYA